MLSDELVAFDAANRGVIPDINASEAIGVEGVGQNFHVPSFASFAMIVDIDAPIVMREFIVVDDYGACAIPDENARTFSAVVSGIVCEAVASGVGSVSDSRRYIVRRLSAESASGYKYALVVVVKSASGDSCVASAPPGSGDGHADIETANSNVIDIRPLSRWKRAVD
jgi:hypothetical protein